MTIDNNFHPPKKQPMRKKIALIDILLLMIAEVADIYQTLKDPFNLFSEYYQRFYGEIPPRWKKDNLKNLLKYSFNKKYLKKGKKKISLTKNGEKRLKTTIPHLFFKKDQWDSKLRLAIFDIQEINRPKRNSFRHFIKKLGFIMWQKSVWITPYNQLEILETWIKENKLEDKILLIEVNASNIKYDPQLLSKFWQAK